MGGKQSMLEFAREPAGGGYGRAWCFPVQCTVVARICQGVSHGEAAHAAFKELPGFSQIALAVRHHGDHGSKIESARIQDAHQRG